MDVCPPQKKKRKKKKLGGILAARRQCRNRGERKEYPVIIIDTHILTTANNYH